MGHRERDSLRCPLSPWRIIAYLLNKSGSPVPAPARPSRSLLQGEWAAVSPVLLFGKLFGCQGEVRRCTVLFRCRLRQNKINQNGPTPQSQSSACGTRPIRGKEPPHCGRACRLRSNLDRHGADGCRWLHRVTRNCGLRQAVGGLCGLG